MKKIYVSIVLLLCFISNVFALQIVDQKNRVIKFETPFKRIISLYPAHAEVISGLGAKELLIGASFDKKFLEENPNMPLYTYHDNAEKFISAKPDLILIRPMIEKRFKGLIKILKDNGIEVVSLQPAKYDELTSYWTKIGKLIGKEKESKIYIKSFNERVNQIKSISKNIPKEKKRKVFFESRHKNFLTTAPGTIAYTLLENIGAINIAKDAKPVRRGSTVAAYKLEKILAKGKNIDIFIAQKGAMNRVSLDEIYKTPGFLAIKAIKDKKVYQVNEDIVSRPTARIILGMNYLGKTIYPEYFN